MHRTLAHRDQSRLIWDCDIAQIARRLRTSEDWAALQGRVADTVQYESLRDSLEAASERFGFRPPDGFADFSTWPVPKAQAGSILIRDTDPRWPSGLVQVLQDNRAVSLGYKVRSVIRLAFPPSEYMKRRFPPRYPWLLPLSYAQRLWKWGKALVRSKPREDSR